MASTECDNVRSRCRHKTGERVSGGVGMKQKRKGIKRDRHETEKKG